MSFGANCDSDESAIDRLDLQRLPPGSRRRSAAVILRKRCLSGRRERAGRIADPVPKSISRRFFERERGGTLFIDGIEELRGGVQAELSSWLEKGVSSVPPVDKTQSPVRIIAGASGLLESRRSSGTFSETLFYRLNVIHIDLSRTAFRMTLDRMLVSTDA